MDGLWWCFWEGTVLCDRLTAEKDYFRSTWTHWATHCDIKKENGSESFPQQPSDMLQQEAQRRHSHAGRVPFSCVNPQVCRLLDELQANETRWGRRAKVHVMNVMALTRPRLDYSQPSVWIHTRTSSWGQFSRCQPTLADFWCSWNVASAAVGHLFSISPPQHRMELHGKLHAHWRVRMCVCVL